VNDAAITPILLSLLGLVATAAGVFFWRMLTRMEDKIDRWWEEYLACRQYMEEIFVRKEDWKEERSELWNRVNAHKHDPNGRVVITGGE